ncbi:hypothetical protein M0R36_01465 [bacterium]|jgi:small nuclear ribonucleoprotein (snRNP)-like protein|nr:hypothetical protein [bacterium]
MVMQDTFAITIIFIVAATFIGAFIKGRSKDRCLDHFSGAFVTVITKDMKTIWGRLKAEHSSLELFYPDVYRDEKDNHIETSYIIYKNEFAGILMLVRFLGRLNGEEGKKRDIILKKAYHPGFFQRVSRNTRNIFGTIKDSIMEISALFVGKIKTAVPAGKFLSGQEKYVSQIQGQVVSGIGMSYEPVLERHIGKRVVVSYVLDSKKREFSGILRDYTAEFIELMDTEFKLLDDKRPEKADIVIPRSIGVVRHLGE